MRIVFNTIVLAIFTTFLVGCTTMSNTNDLKISVEDNASDGDYPKERSKEEFKAAAQKPHLWKGLDGIKKKGH
jgi:hypothetical protein